MPFYVQADAIRFCTIYFIQHMTSIPLPLYHTKRSSHFRYPALLIFIFCCSVFAATFPARPQGYIADYANVIDNQSKEKLTAIAQALYEQAGFALIVATIPDLGSEVIEDYAPALYKEWGIGKKGVDEGALILLSLNPRKVRIEVGLGSEGYLPDAMTGRLLDTYGVPWFRKNDYSTGMASLAAAVAQIVEREKTITLSAPTGVQTPPAMPPVKISPIWVILGIIVLIIMLSTRTGRTILWMMILMSLTNGRSSGRSGGGGFGGGFGGGGFGGGMSGGGGASRGF